MQGSSSSQHPNNPFPERSQTDDSPNPLQINGVYESSSWGSSRGLSSYVGFGASQPALPWSAVRHQVIQDEKAEADVVIEKAAVVGLCSQAVFVTCLHLSHEMVLRDVGRYAWTAPSPKDPSGSTMKIMKQYVNQAKAINQLCEVHVRAAPDPSKPVIQHHLQKARLGAGANGYVAVYYLGHGIQEPPTEAEELWCYDKSFEECAQTGASPSEYIPILLFDLLTWAGPSTCYVWDCQHAGRFIKAAVTEAEEIDSQLRAAAARNPQVAEVHPAVYSARQIHFAACAANQTVPRVPGLPDDLFTSCLTTPLQIALLYHNLQIFPLSLSDRGSQKSNDYMAALWLNMSDDLKFRLWKDLEAIIEAIAWQTLDGKAYQQLFGKCGDSVCNLACGFLVAQRVMGTYHTNPESLPTIPSSTTSHALWTTWDLILDNFFEQVPDYFDPGVVDTTWESKLKLVSFMEDQLHTILNSDNHALASITPDHLVGLSRLPIIVQAAQKSELRKTACAALDNCLRGLDFRSLAHAIQGGALHLAAQLLAVDDPSIASELIGIWASLVRHDASVLVLAYDARSVEFLTSIPGIKFFMDNLEIHARSTEPSSGTTAVQTSVVLCTIAQYVAGRSFPKFVARILELCLLMLCHPEGLVQQWGALLTAETLGSFIISGKDNADILNNLHQQLMSMFKSERVETRATAVYALSRWISTTPIREIQGLKSTTDYSKWLAWHYKEEASPLVRKELICFFHRILLSGGIFTTVGFLLHFLTLATNSFPHEKTTCEELVRSLNGSMKLDEDGVTQMVRINEMIRKYSLSSYDPSAPVAKMAINGLRALTSDLKGYFKDVDWERLFRAAFPVVRGTDLWTMEQLELLKGAIETMRDSWEQRVMEWQSEKSLGYNNELFERSKASLRAYLAEDHDGSETREANPSTPGASSSEMTVKMRYRVLEDSMVLAEQQMGLPWKWAMKDMSTPDPWKSLQFHSFLGTVLSCNKSNSLLLWDWASSRKTGQINLEVPPGAYVSSARFVNELHEQTTVLAEINTGDVHVICGPPDEPGQMKTVSSFLALDASRSPHFKSKTSRALRTSWWRQSGKLCAAGSSDIVNVWDCAAEKNDRVLNTESDYSCETIIHEPVSGNLMLLGFADGFVKMFDLRQSRRTPLFGYNGDPYSAMGSGILKIGMVLGESANITCATLSGYINIHDFRFLTQPTASIHVHPGGTEWASFQPHSGLMSTISTLNATPQPSSTSSSPSHSSQKFDNPNHSLSAQTQSGGRGRGSATFGLYRSTLSSISTVNQETIQFPPQGELDTKIFQPFTILHPLRPILAIGYGRSTILRGSGVGKGDDFDSGSYVFLKSQEKYKT